MPLTIDDVADGLKTSTTNGPLVDVEGLSLLMKPEQQEIAPDIEHRIDPSRQKRERQGGDRGVHCAESIEAPK